MALSLVGVNVNIGSSVVIPAHLAGDFIELYAYNGAGATAPVKPSAAGTVPDFTYTDNPVGFNTNASATAQYVATAPTTTSGTWTNTTHMIAVVLRGQAASPVGGHAESGSTSATGVVSPAIPMTRTDGTSVVLEFGGHKSPVTALAAAPAGYTRQIASSDFQVFLNIKDVTTSDGAVTQPVTATANGYRGATVEVLAGNTAWTAGASLAATATPSAGAAAALLTGASLGVTATPTAVGSRGQSMDAALAVAALFVDVGRYDANANANLLLDAALQAAGTKGLNGLASLAIVAVTDASVATGPAIAAALAVVATSIADASVGRIALAELAVEAVTSAGLSSVFGIEAALELVANATANFAGAFWEVVIVPFEDRNGSVGADDRFALVVDADRHASVNDAG